MTGFELSQSRPLHEVIRGVVHGTDARWAHNGDDLLSMFPPPPMLRRMKPHPARRPMMRVESVYQVTGRGLGLGVRLPSISGPVTGAAQRLGRRWMVVRRDGTSWPLRGIERFMVNRDLVVGDRIGLLVPFGAEVAVGDLVEFREEAADS